MLNIEPLPSSDIFMERISQIQPGHEFQLKHIFLPQTLNDAITWRGLDTTPKAFYTDANKSTKGQGKT